MELQYKKVSENEYDVIMTMIAEKDNDPILF